MLLLNGNPLDLVERDLVAGAVVGLGGAWAFMRRHGLGVFQRAAHLEVGGDAGRAEHVATELDLEAGFGGAPADHAVGVNAVHRFVGQRASRQACGSDDLSCPVPETERDQ
jgi:hypothetical protein